LVATVIKNESRRGLSATEVQTQTNQLIETLRRQGAPLYFSTGSQVETTINALNMLKLRKLISENDGRYQAKKEEYDILAYYANSIVHWLPDDQKN